MKKLAIGIFVLLISLLGVTYISVAYTGSKAKTVCEVNGYEDLDAIDFSKHDSLDIAASTYYEANTLKKIMQGEHYRDAWATSVRVPIVYLDTLLGGLTVVDVGGGKQTKSLDLLSPDLIMYTLRSVNKDPGYFVSDFLESVGLENIVEDGMSAQHPYGAIAVANLAETLDIPHTHPRLVFIPKQKALDTLNIDYGNKLYLLEYETESSVNWSRIPNASEIIETDDLQELKMNSDKEVLIDQSAFIRVRLFDLLIGDWDRHAKQWGWALTERRNTVIAHPVAGDRDNAFYNLGGVIPNIIANKNITEQLRPFKEEIDFLPGLVRRIDRYMLLDAEESMFVEEAIKLSSQLTDQKIKDAIQKWPKEIYELDGEAIIQKIKTRRDNLDRYATEFYRIIQEMGPLEQPMPGSDDVILTPDLLKCFNC